MTASSHTGPAIKQLRSDGLWWKGLRRKVENVSALRLDFTRMVCTIDEMGMNDSANDGRGLRGFRLGIFWAAAGWKRGSLLSRLGVVLAPFLHYGRSSYD